MTQEIYCAVCGCVTKWYVRFKRKGNVTYEEYQCSCCGKKHVK